MILATHSIIGAGLASFFPDNPGIAFSAAFASHFALDAIPHWEYKTLSRTKNEANRLDEDIKFGKNFFIDLRKIFLDTAIGATLAVLIFHYYFGASLPLVLIGITGGLLPDALQFVYFKIRKEPLILLQKGHLKAHNNNENLSKKFPKIGFFLQVLLNVCFILLVLLFA